MVLLGLCREIVGARKQHFYNYYSIKYYMENNVLLSQTTGLLNDTEVSSSDLAQVSTPNKIFSIIVIFNILINQIDLKRKICCMITTEPNE